MTNCPSLRTGDDGGKEKRGNGGRENFEPLLRKPKENEETGGEIEASRRRN